MFNVQKGDVFAHLKGMADSGWIFLHGCNAQGVMGSGVAANVKSLWPAAYSEYKLKHSRVGLPVGDNISVCVSGKDNQYVINAITQKYYGRDKDKVYVDYDAVRGCLLQARSAAKNLNLSIHFPFIGGGLANGDRDVLMKIFEEVFASGEDVSATLWVVD